MAVSNFYKWISTISKDSWMKSICLLPCWNNNSGFFIHFFTMTTEKSLKFINCTGLHKSTKRIEMLEGEGYWWLPMSSVTFLMLCWTHILCWSSSLSRCSSSSISSFNCSNRSDISNELHPGPAPLQWKQPHELDPSFANLSSKQPPSFLVSQRTNKKICSLIH